MNTSISSLIRADGWDRELERIASTQVAVIPKWGVSDCMMSACDAIAAIVGVHPLAHLVGRYSTETGAAKQMRTCGCDNVKQMFESYMQLVPVNRFSARRGDVGVTIINDEYVAGYVCSLGFAVKQPLGTVFLSLSDIDQAYKVGA